MSTNEMFSRRKINKITKLCQSVGHCDILKRKVCVLDQVQIWQGNEEEAEETAFYMYFLNFPFLGLSEEAGKHV